MIGFGDSLACVYRIYTPLPQLSMTLGNGKNKIGYGYRSIWLSDAAFNYPYLKMAFQDKQRRIQYNILYALFSNLSNGGAATPPNIEPLFQKKPSVFHHLEWRPHSRFYLELFQGTVWKAANDQNKLALDFNYFNPLIYSNAIVYGLNKSVNVYTGLGWHAKLFKNMHVYNYWTLDDIDVKIDRRQKSALQIGFKCFDLFGIQGLFAQTEYTRVSPFAFDGYGSGTSISHYNQGIAYSLPSNTHEFLQLLRYEYKRCYIDAQLSLLKSVKPLDLSTYLPTTPQALFDQYNLYSGYNVMAFENINTIPQYKNQVKQFIKDRQFAEIKCGYIINTKSLLCLQMGYMLRKADLYLKQESENIIYLGISSRIYQRYWDN
jgi:hypothetical protein